MQSPRQFDQGLSAGLVDANMLANIYGGLVDMSIRDSGLEN